MESMELSNGKTNCINFLLALRSGFLAGPSSVRAGRASNINGRLKAKGAPTSAAPPSGGWAAQMTP